MSFYDDTTKTCAYDGVYGWHDGWYSVTRPLLITKKGKEKRPEKPRKRERHINVFFMPHTTSSQRALRYDKRKFVPLSPAPLRRIFRAVYRRGRDAPTALVGRQCLGRFYGAMAWQKKKSLEKIKSLSETWRASVLGESIGRRRDNCIYHYRPHIDDTSSSFTEGTEGQLAHDGRYKS